MRALLATACAAALVACSDAKTPTVTAPSLVPTGRLDTVSHSTTHVDSRSVLDRVAGLVGAKFSKVVLPPDLFSLSSDAVHPDVACQDGLWNGTRCWFMYTPYKNSDASWENPGFLLEASDTTWSTPPSIRNPIVPYPGIGAYNSDPDHAFDPVTKRLTQVYRVVADSFNKIMIMSTANASTWTTARLAFKERNHDAISPSLVIDRDRSANLWYVRSGAAGCNSATSTVVMRTATPTADQLLEQATWSPAVPVNLSVPNFVIWHLDVAALPDDRGYVALVVAYNKNIGCGYDDLWLATSPDGITWRTFAVPLFWRDMQLARTRSISTWYRGTLRYDAATDSLHLWPSALAGPNWTIYHTAIKMSDLLRVLSSAQPEDAKGLFNAQPANRLAIPMP